MKLPSLFSFHKKQVKNYFLALLLQDETVGAVVFEEQEGKLHVIGQSLNTFSSSLENAPFEEFLETIDKAISSAEEVLPNNTQTEKCVFGVKSEWIEEGKIKKNYLLKLKKMCDELSLTPIGFLVFSEAIIHLLQKEEGAPLSAIFIETGKKYITISIVRAGRIIETKQVAFEEHIPQTVDTALKHFTDVEILPARVILFDSENNEKMAQSFISHSWSKALPFLHMPQVTVLPSNFDTKAILYGTATQMGFDVLQNQTGMPIKTHVEAIQPLEKAFISEEIHDDIPLQEFGEDEEKELAIKRDEEIPEEDEETLLPETVSSDYFGFMNNEDVAKSKKLNINAPITPINDNFAIPTDRVAQEISEIPEMIKERQTDINHAGGGFPLQGILVVEGAQKIFKNMRIKDFLTPLMKRIQRTTKESGRPSIHNAQGVFGMNKVILVILAVIILCIVGIVLYITTLKATVTIFVTPKTVEEKQTITFTPGGNSDFGNNILAVDTPSVDESNNISGNATGVKEVGTPAKGTITIFSRLSSTTNLSKGTTITGNGLQFTLDNPATIASFSGDANDSSVTVSNIAVTAKNIGKESNLPSGTKFNIDGLSTADVSGKNDAAFSGGTKKTITVVTQKDLDNLASTLTTNLESKAKTDLSKTLDINKQLLPFFLKEALTKQTYTKNVNDEASTVSLDGTITYQGVTLDKIVLTAFAQNILKDKIPVNMTISSEGIKTDVSDITNGKIISASVNLKASLLPNLNVVDIAKNISGKSFTEGKQVIKTLPQIEDVTIINKPNLPFLPKILPRLSKNITIVVQSND